MNIFKKVLVGALLLASMCAQNGHAMKRKLDANGQSRAIQPVEDPNIVIDHALSLADQGNLFAIDDFGVDPFSYELTPDTQVLIFTFALQGHTMTDLMKGLTKLVRVCKCWHGIIFSQSSTLTAFLKEIWSRGNCQSINLLQYCAKRGFGRASKFFLDDLAKGMIAQKDNPEVAKKIALNDVGIIPDLSGNTALHYAAQGGHEAIVQLLTDNCLNVDIVNSIEKTPIMCAAERGHYEIVLYLIKKGANLNLCDKQKMTSLHYAVLSGNQDLIQFVIDACDNIDALDNNNKTPLHHAAQIGNLETVIRLIIGGSEAMSDWSWSKNSPLVFALENNHLAVAQYLYTMTNNSILKSDDAVFELKKNAATHGWLDTLKYLYEITTFDYLIGEWSHLCAAAIHGHKDVVKFLLDKFQGYEDFAKLLNHPVYKRTIISFAIAEGQEEIITLLLDAGAEVTKEDLKRKPRTFSSDLEKRLNNLTSSCVIS